MPRDYTYVLRYYLHRKEVHPRPELVPDAKEMVRLAEAEDAPSEAVYRAPEGWVTVDGIMSSTIRDVVLRAPPEAS